MLRLVVFFGVFWGVAPSAAPFSKISEQEALLRSAIKQMHVQGENVLLRPSVQSKSVGPKQLVQSDFLVLGASFEASAGVGSVAEIGSKASLELHYKVVP